MADRRAAEQARSESPSAQGWLAGSDRVADPGVERSKAAGRSGDDGGAANRGRGASNAAAEGAYLAELQRAIAKHKGFPDDAIRRRSSGTATVSFTVLADGRIRSVRLAKTSGDASLDQAALQALHRLGRFKPIPGEFGRKQWQMSVPIRFSLK
jgi:protein TonB